MRISAKISIIIVTAAALIIICTGLFWAVFFFPDDYSLTQSEAQIPGRPLSQKMDIDVLEYLPKARFAGDVSPSAIQKNIEAIKREMVLVKREAYASGKYAHLRVRIGTGHQGIWVDERSALLLPAKARIIFPVMVKKAAEIEFSALAPLEKGELIITTHGGGVLRDGRRFTFEKYSQKFSAGDARLKYMNRGFPSSKDDVGWRTHRIDLSPYAGKTIEIDFTNSGDGVLAIANPRIFVPASARRYNVIYIIFDGVSTRLWSMYNPDSSLTPYMKQVADEDFIVFENMFTLGDKTRISTVGLFCSIFPFLSRHGINRNFIPENEIDLFYEYVHGGRFLPLPEFFRRNGYISRQFGNSGFTVQLLGTGVDYGFDSSFEFSYNPYDTYGISTRFFDFLRNNGRREFFAYLHYNTPHKPFYAPLRYYLKGIINAPLASLWRPDFMGCISYTDDAFKNLYEALKTHGLLDNSIIVIATDHGSGFDLSKFDAGFQYIDYTRMTFMMHLPPALRQELGITRKRINTYISQINIAPTLVELAGMKQPRQFMGKSFVSLLKKPRSATMFDSEIWSFGRKTFSVIDSNLYKYILTFDETKKFVNRSWAFFGEEREVPSEQLYEVKKDPFETENLVGTHKHVLESFRKKVIARDIHHPEKNVISFFPGATVKKSKVDVILQSKDMLINMALYRANLEVAEGLKITRAGNTTIFSFELEKEARHLMFEHRNDRTAISVKILLDGKLISKETIYAAPLMLHLLKNPFTLSRREDFLLLSSTKIPSTEDILLQGGKEACVIVSRIDLHRWIDVGKLEEKSLSAGMKQTLKSWGYIQ